MRNNVNIRPIPNLAVAALLILASVAFPLLGVLAGSSAVPAGPAYPTARRGHQVDEYHAIKVADPYRWMEDIDSPPTRAWVEAEAKLTSDYLAAIPGRDKIAQRLKEIWNFERWSAPEKHGPRWFYTHNDGL